jgi:hypothetical protein
MTLIGVFRGIFLRKFFSESKLLKTKIFSRELNLRKHSDHLNGKY